jgi:hypothetical protein
MKKLFIAFLAMFILTISSYATASVPNAINVENRSDFTKFDLNLGDVTNMTEKDINSKINTFLDNTLKSLTNKSLNCTVKITGTVTVGVAKVELSVEVSGPCDEIAKAGKQIAQEIFNQIKRALTS